MTRRSDDVAALFDLHVHSRHSPDGQGGLKDLAQAAQARGLQGFAVTDHNTFRMATEIRRLKPRGLLVVPGIELSTRVGHCLALGVQEAVPPHLPLAETLEAIEDAGGVGVPSHPYRLIHGVGEGELDHAIQRLKAIEVFNARNRSGPPNEKAGTYARTHRLAGTGGSDAHQVFELGNAYTLFPEVPGGVDDVVRMLRRKKTWGGGSTTPRAQLLRQNVKNAWLFAQRGFRSI